MKNFLFILCLVVPVSSICQSIDLRKNFTSLDSTDFNTSFQFLDTLGNRNHSLHFKYLYFKYLQGTLDGKEIQDLSQYGMFQEVEEQSKAYFDKNKKHAFLTIQLQQDDLKDIDEFIKENAHQKVVIYNDSHERMETRAFFLSKLKLHRELGYTHLAMEAFNDITEPVPSIFLGYYFQEPLMAEIFRDAKRLGFKILQYECFEENRMEDQALNLVNQIKNLNNEDKVLVFAGQSNLLDDVPEGSRFFGSILKNELQIDPLTIDLTRGLKWPTSTDFIFEKHGEFSKGGIISSKRVKDKMGFGMVDYFYIHPDYSLENERPDWLKVDGVRKPYSYCNKEKSAVLVQAFYTNELKDDSSLNYVTPADVIYKTDSNSNALFYLTPGFSYTIVSRDENDKVIKKEEILF